MTDTISEVPTQEQADSPEQVAEVVVNTIKAENPSTEEMVSIREQITANYNFEVDTKAVSFNFKKSKDKLTGIETVRESVLLGVPYPSVNGLIAIISGEHLEEGQANKGLELLMEAMETVVNAQCRDLLYEDLTLNAGSFPVEQVSWEFIANIPKVTRRGGGIPKETWEGFAQDYVSVMPEATGKTIEQVAMAAKILAGKCSSVRTNEPVLNLLTGQLAIYVDKSENAGDYTECVEFLVAKIHTFLNVSEEELLANL